MDIHRSEEEQVEAIKRWWQENGKQTVVILIVAIGVYTGWNAWQNNQETNRAAASAQYQDMLDALNAQEGQITEVQLQTARHLAMSLRKDFSGSSYAVYAALLLAKLAVEQGDYAGAEKELQWALVKSDESALKSLTQLRLARVVFADNRIDEALALLNNAQAGIYQAAYEESKGDVFMDQGEKEKAREAYQAAVSLRKEEGEQVSRFLEMKLQGLSEPDSAMIFDMPDVYKPRQKKASETDTKKETDNKAG